jgi:hypothetical protein
VYKEVDLEVVSLHPVTVVEMDWTPGTKRHSDYHHWQFGLLDGTRGLEIKATVYCRLANPTLGEQRLINLSVIEFIGRMQLS